jgi:endonuclease/exonuclease/phosphatase family metal-dependent hydrolase
VIGEVTFGVIGLLFLFADIRTFSSTFQLTFFGSSNTTLAVMAVSVFATSFLALLVSWRLGPRRALGSSAALFAVATLLCTASRNNLTDLGLSVIALAAGFWWLAFLHSARTADASSPLARALPVAFACDLALRAIFRTVAVPDLAWPAAVLIVFVGALVFIAAGLTAMPAERIWMRPEARGLLALLVLPALILVAETGGTNGAQVAAAAGLGLGPEPARATQIGQLVVGLGLAVGALSLMRFPARGIVAAAGIAVGGALLWLQLPVLSLIGGAILGAAVVIAGAALLGAPLRATRSPALVVVPLSFGWIVFVAAAFGFYAFWAYQPAVYAAIGIVALGALIAPGTGVRLGLPLALLTATIALGAPIVAFLSTPVARATDAPRLNFRVMTYNIHQGFDAGQIPSLDAIVDLIARESPDVVCLQEVARGWTIDEQHDALSIIAERLGLQYAWLPAIGGLYGDAVLSRFPMTDVKQIHYAREPGLSHQPRGVLFLRTGGVLVGCTHLDDISDASVVRQEQVRTIIRVIADIAGATEPLIVAGDLNATPDAIEVRLLNEFGLDDLGAPAGDTTTGDNPQKRIDYIWGRNLVGAQAHTVGGQDLQDAKRASDHRPLILNVTVTGR